MQWTSGSPFSNMHYRDGISALRTGRRFSDSCFNYSPICILGRKTKFAIVCSVQYSYSFKLGCIYILNRTASFLFFHIAIHIDVVKLTHSRTAFLQQDICSFNHNLLHLARRFQSTQMSAKGTKRRKVLPISLRARGFQPVPLPLHSASSVKSPVLLDDEDDEDAYGSRSRASITRAQGSRLVC